MAADELLDDERRVSRVDMGDRVGGQLGVGGRWVERLEGDGKPGQALLHRARRGAVCLDRCWRQLDDDLNRLRRRAFLPLVRDAALADVPPAVAMPRRLLYAVGGWCQEGGGVDRPTPPVYSLR